ncbi:hypothetical protein [Lewinella sp. IMCC34183]|uniref:hypothetical protein n=1 Tax=Lewinella sp. IMCC34183 TaxID=2248762 RepID=UPI001300308D|nr:hypothetical protein [Lewinella sp. IMCC34183]
MKPMLFTFLLLLGTCVSAQRSAQTELEDGTHYTYTLKSDAVDRFELVQAFARASGVTVHPSFSGDWTTTDSDGIEYSLNTPRHFLAIRYRGDDAATTEVARRKARVIREDLHLPQEAPTPERGGKI